MQQAKLIYNPNAGVKRNLGKNGVSLEDITAMLNQYQISFKLSPTKKAGDALRLSREAVKEGYKTVLIAGGDGTVGEAANGLVGSDVRLGIIPMGSFMNIAKMLSIPLELEKAIEIIKIGRVRKIDAGLIKEKAEGESGKDYFLESAGIGMEANFHKLFKMLEKGKIGVIIDIFRLIFHYHRFKAKVFIDDGEMEVYTHLITVSNAPMSGASLNTAPQAKLNDHKLTVSVYKMSKFQIFNYLVRAFTKKELFHPQIATFSTKKALVKAEKRVRVHTDGRFFTKTPVEFSVVPHALNVISGFPDSEDSPLLKRTALDP